jgi:hypothetical protein
MGRIEGTYSPEPRASLLSGEVTSGIRGVDCLTILPEVNGEPIGVTASSSTLTTCIA